MLSNGEVPDEPLDIAVCASLGHMEFGAPIDEESEEAKEGKRETIEDPFPCDPTD